MLSSNHASFVSLQFWTAIFSLALSCHPSFAAAESKLPLRPPINSTKPLTLVGTVRLTERNFPRLMQQQADVDAAKHGITLQKIREYNPSALMSYQDAVASHNRLTQTLFGSAVLPATPGPGPESVSMRPNAFSAAGFIIDWAPIDFGLHKARINYSKSEYKLSQAAYNLTLLDVCVDSAARFLDALVMREQVQVARANVQQFSDFSTIVHAKVNAGLKPGADASLADSQLANARNDLIRARLNSDLAKTDLGFITGQGGELIEIDPGGIVLVTEPTDSQQAEPDFFAHPLAQTRKAEFDVNIASRKILSKEYYPTLRWLGGVNLRGTTFDTNRGDVPAPDVSGIFPVVPNWNVGLMIDFPFLDIIRIKAEEKVVDDRIRASQSALDLAIQRLKTDNVQARVKVQAAVELAANMPVQVRAAEEAAQQAQARYAAGLATVAQVAEANQILADSRVKEAVANVGVWKALLATAAAHGDLRPFLTAADSATQKETP
ncbi:MAG: TolC family protein [Candidatus Melainabacteria bacterium]|nr:TolC family protein [Candidatus Melainabacteria bacterium]